LAGHRPFRDLTPTIQVVAATWEYGAAVAANMRPADVAEVWALARHSPAEAVTRSLGLPGEAYAFLVDDEPLAVFGCAETSIPDTGSPWLLGAVGVERHARQFLELGRSYVAHWAHEYTDLYNVVDARNERSIDWLGRLGFVFDEPILIGATPFLPFHLRRPNV
jgi:hypothetical protein